MTETKIKSGRRLLEALWRLADRGESTYVTMDALIAARDSEVARREGRAS